MNPIRVGVIDDQPLLVGAFCALVCAQKDMEVVATAAHGAAGVEALRRAADDGVAADVVLMDIRMPVMDGVAATRAISHDPRLAGTRVLILTTFNEEELVLAALTAGASGFLLKDAEPSTLLAAVRALAAGQGWLDPAVTATVLTRLGEGGAEPSRGGASAIASCASARDSARDDVAAGSDVARSCHGPLPPLLPGAEPLTDREQQILELVCRGWSNTRIAAELFLATTTVKSHVKAVLAKTGCANRVELIVATLGR
ncbi:MAG: response regulator transcription factor [Actinomyces urogenitalis]|uniref:response regulator transcription factor n=1 Tax=Actinomyces urogenitalis TaxID=103621 RepID=UPI002A82C4F2|nr:response regulator transcription factor [Actinomyces urogenitalis]MDY3678048.1 response regulator transcription factor [Actinomyces urogenitalis]